MEEPQKNPRYISGMLITRPPAKIMFTSSVKELVEKCKVIRLDYIPPAARLTPEQMDAQIAEIKRRRAMRIYRAIHRNKRRRISNSNRSKRSEEIPSSSSSSHGAHSDGRQNPEKGDETSQEKILEKMQNTP